ncbi:MAG: ferrous iron transport protein B, partial [Chthoniobacterales bacterium]|nr:ferrous iron transport protein B [Chthoniobacterales bacterium]
AKSLSGVPKPNSFLFNLNSMTNNSPIRIALIGNPNTGKSTLFNRLTGLRQHITNYPGTTVLAHTGFSHIEDKQVQFIDLPGIYSLSASSPDEKVVFDLLLCDNKIDLILFILDSTNLRRSFFLIYQLAEFEIPCLLVLNQWDQAIRNCIKINLKLLKSRLPVPIVTTIARNGIGLEELRSAIATSLKSPSRFPLPQWPTIIEECRQTLLNAGANLSLNLKPPEATRIIFDSDSIYLKNFSPSLHSQLSQLQSQIQNRLRQNGFNLSIAEATIHYRKIDKLLENVIQSDGTIARSDSPLDSILLHKFWGPVIFFAIMFLVFQSLYAWSAPFTDAIESLIALAKDNVFLWLEKFPILQSLTTDGILTGVGSVLVFLPQILLLFLFISLLEESGYLARAAFIMDKALAWCGLNGKCFVPLLSGYACSIPAILSTRTLDSPSARLTTTLLIPFMSCSARLPVYTLFISAFIEPKYGPNIAALSLFFMHFVGPLVAFP